MYLDMVCAAVKDWRAKNGKGWVITMAVKTTICLVCKRSIKLGPWVKKGGWFACPHCGAGLKLVSLDPPMLTWASARSLAKRRANPFWPTESEDY